MHYVELDQFVGRNYLVTVHGPLNPAVAPGRLPGYQHSDPSGGKQTAPDDLAVRVVVRDRLGHDPREADLIADLAKESGLLEQRVMLDDDLEDPEAFLEELFQAWYVLLALRTIAMHSSASYGRMARLVRFLPDAAPPLFADIADQFDVIKTMADGQREFLHGVIEFYQTGPRHI